MIVRFTFHGKKALDNVYDWYKSQGNSKTGRKKRAAIIKKVKRLKEHPFIGQEEETLKERGDGHRYLVEGNYKIIY